MNKQTKTLLLVAIVGVSAYMLFLAKQKAENETPVTPVTPATPAGTPVSSDLSMMPPTPVASLSGSGMKNYVNTKENNFFKMKKTAFK